MNRLSAAYDEHSNAWTQEQAPDLRRAGASVFERPCSEMRADPPFTLDQALDPAYPAVLFPPEWRV